MSSVHSSIRAKSAQPSDWAQANQDYLVLEFARLRNSLTEAASGRSGPTLTDPNAPPEIPAAELDHRLREIRVAMDAPPAIDVLSQTFQLTAFERDVLLLSAGVEMDSTLAHLCSSSLGREHRTSISFALALATLGDPHWSALAPGAPLRRFQLVSIESGHGLTAAPLRIDERILHYLVGVNHLDHRLEPLLQPKIMPRWVAPEHRTLADEIRGATDLNNPQPTILHLCGDDPRGQEDIAALLAEAAGRRLYVLQVENIPTAGGSTFSESGATEIAQLVILWTREAALLPAVLLLQCGNEALTNSARQFLERVPSPLILGSRDSIRIQRSSIRHTVNKPQPAGQKHLWEQALGLAAQSLNGHLNHLAEHFRLSAGTIASVGEAALSPDGRIDPDRLWSTCRSLSRPRLEDLAERILPAASWSDLILPDAQTQVLHQLANQARHRMTVYESWGFSDRGRRGLGISALFAGASGTGKTLAAEVLARELRLDLYRIDLSAVVSKYIGESEKNLKQVFDAAEEGGVLLLFDEADALFGKRAEVKDSHDRYANIEVSYLLQRMESFQGLAVLTTNLKSSLDKAFQRRLRFTVDFPFPGAPEREAIWQRVFPAKAPTAGLDFKRLAQLNMTGGNIRNIALNAAFLAAEAGTSVAMEHLLQATRQEAVKTERPLSEAETRGWL